MPVRERANRSLTLPANRCGWNAQAFLQAIETRQPPLTDGQSGLRVLKVLQSAQRSLVMNGELVVMSMEMPVRNGVT